MINNEIELAQRRLADPLWRINNLYNIVSKQGTKTLFRLNWAQEELYNNMWYCNIVLKARQLGMSTFICLLFLDRCLFNSNISAGIICHTLEDGQQLFRRVKFAFDNLPEEIKKLISADNDTAGMLKFSNGSSIRVGMSLRSSTFQFLHISEFGKICAKYPDKATEIITGSLNTLAAGQYAFIESTSEGREGPFYEMCKQAQALSDSGKELTKLDFRFHFFPWHREPTYRLGSSGGNISVELQEYFISLLGNGIRLDDEQKYWYAHRFSTQGEHMKREFPSTPSECWETSNEGCYYAKHVTQARIEKRIGHVPYDDSLPVFTAWDLGYNDSTTIWFFQVYGKEIRLIDYVEGSGESLSHWLGVVKSKPYVYEKFLCPHDILVHEYSSGMTRQASARKMGINLIPVKKVDIIPGIDAARNIFNRCWFDEKKCEKGIRALENYKKEWNDRAGCWASQPLHNWASHGCFVANTEIECCGGNKKICDIQVGDMVCTPNGYKKVIQTYSYDVHELLEIVTTTSKFTCTPNHKIFTEEGLVYADGLRHGMMLYNNEIWSKKLCRKLYGSNNSEENIGFRESFILQKTKSMLFTRAINTNCMGTIIEDIITPIKAFPHHCIGPYGQITLEKSPQAITSTIGMEIQKITQSKIFNVYRDLHTCLTQPEKANGLGVRQTNNSSMRRKKKQNYGMQVRRVWRGIEHMVRSHGRADNLIKNLARTVLKCIKHFTQIVLSSVMSIAKTSRDVSQALMTKIDNVSFAISGLWFLNMLSPERVVNIVPRHLQKAQKVYDFAVEDDHCYYANGILVSNSDAFRTLATGLHYITGQQSPAERERANLEQARDSSGLYPGSFMYTATPRLPGGKSSIF